MGLYYRRLNFFIGVYAAFTIDIYAESLVYVY